MKKYLVVSLSTIVMAILPRAHAHATFERGTLSLTPTAGVIFFDSTENLKNSPTLGLKIVYGVFTSGSGGMSVEGFASAAQQESNAGGAKARAYLFRVGPLFSLPGIGRLTPLMSIGFGGMRSTINYSSPRTNMLATFGLGANYDFSRRMAIRSDITRLFVMDTNGSNGFEWTVGVSYTFGAVK